MKIFILFLLLSSFFQKSLWLEESLNSGDESLLNYRKYRLVENYSHTLASKNKSPVLYKLTEILNLYVDLKIISGEEIPKNFKRLLANAHLVTFINQSEFELDRIGSKNIRKHYLNKKELEQIGDLFIDYDSYGRIISFGDMKIEYESFDNRIVKIGDIEIDFDSFKNRVTRINEIYIDYDLDGRIERIGDLDIYYHTLDKTVEKIGETEVRYNIGSYIGFDRQAKNFRLKQENERLQDENNRLKNEISRLKDDFAHEQQRFILAKQRLEQQIRELQKKIN
jgi:hypothetical protein